MAPCLSSSIAQLMKYWILSLKEGKITGLEFRMYIGGYKGILTGDSFIVPESEWPACEHLNNFGGSPIGNSRVKVSEKNILVATWFFFVFIFGWPEWLKRSNEYVTLSTASNETHHFPL